MLRYPLNSHGVRTLRIFQNKHRRVRAGQSTGKVGGGTQAREGGAGSRVVRKDREHIQRAGDTALGELTRFWELQDPFFLCWNVDF